MTTDANTTFWLSLIAIASVVQAMLLVAAAVVLFRLARATRVKIADIHTRQIAPLVERARHTLDEVEDVVRRVRAIDDEVRTAVAHAGARVDQAATLVRQKMAPVAGIVRGARAALSVLANGRPSSRTSGPRPVTARDKDDEARFINEGGSHHAPN